MLDMLKCRRQVNEMVDCQLTGQDDFAARVARCQQEAKTADRDWQQLQQKIAASRTTWLVAGLNEGLTAAAQVGKVPRPQAVVASDGSQIFPDRHEISSCYLLNLGLVALYYGSGERPLLSSEPSLYWRTEDLYPRVGRRQGSISPELVGLRRTVLEMARLCQLTAEAVSKGYPTVALSDGTLILWSLEGFEPEWREPLLSGFLQSLAEHQTLGVPIAGYISQPGATDVVNALRVFVCPEAVCNCDHCPYQGQEELPCDWLSGLTDAVLFGRLLRPGEYSPCFFSRSKILQEYGEQRIAFRYLHVGEEVVRLEFPGWLTGAEQEVLLATAYDQAAKGIGYPVALAEAHEQAVIRGADRQAFYDMLAQRMVERGLRAQVSYKSLRKRGIFI